MNDPTFHLESIVKDKNELRDFDGPLSLILMLLSKNKIEIRDISVSEILDQYLEYLDRMEKMDLEISSEFIQMASHLLYIKTRTLLAGEEEVSELEELKSSLEQLRGREIYTAIGKILPSLKAASEKGSLYYSKPPEPLPPSSKEYVYSHEPVELFKAFYSIVTRGPAPTEASKAAVIAPSRIIYEVKTKSRELLKRLSQGSAHLSELYSACSSRSELIATFISILELCSMQSVRLDGDESDYTVSFIGGNVDEILEKITE